MNTTIISRSKAITTLVLASSLLLSVSVQATEKADVKALTAFMVGQNTQQVNQQLSQQLNKDIQFAVMKKLPTVVNKESGVKTLLAKTVVKNNNKNNSKTNNQTSGE